MPDDAMQYFRLVEEADHHCGAECPKECDRAQYLAPVSKIETDPSALFAARNNERRQIVLRSRARALLDATAIHRDCVGELIHITQEQETPS